MANEKRLIDANALIEQQRILYHYSLIEMPLPWMPWKWYGVRIANGVAILRFTMFSGATTKAAYVMPLLAMSFVHTEKGERENDHYRTE